MAFDEKHPGNGPRQEGATPAPGQGVPSPTARGTDAPATARQGGTRKRLILGLGLVAALGVAVVKGHDYWTTGRFMETTDDAYLAADISEISPEVTGPIQEVAVTENQQVRAGDILFRIDDRDYRNVLGKAEAALATHGQTLKRIGAQIDAAHAQVSQAEATQRAAEATLKNAATSAERTRNLNSSSFASQAALDDAVAAQEEAEAQVANARAAVHSALANVAVLEAELAEEEATGRTLSLAVEQAQRNLDRTLLRAPVDGVVANIAGETGELVSPGTVLAAVVPANALYVEANFKETQLAHVSPGAVATLTFDVAPDLALQGRVVSLSPATGALFSLLPPENATGNFTKVVQRVPVRIALPEGAAGDPHLRAGLSTIVTVDTRTGEAARN